MVMLPVLVSANFAPAGPAELVMMNRLGEFCSCRKNQLYDLLLHKNEQLYKLLAIAVAMCPSTTRWLEENVREQLQFKCSDELFEMQSSNVDAFKKAFGLGCPKFVTAAAPDLSEVPTDNHLVGYHEALQIFVKEVISSFFFLLLRRSLELEELLSTPEIKLSSIE